MQSSIVGKGWWLLYYGLAPRQANDGASAGMTDRDAFYGILDHWFAGGGRTLTDDEGPWADYMRRQPQIQTETFRILRERADAIARGGASSGSFATPSSEVILANSYRQEMIFNYVDYSIKGSFTVDYVGGATRVTLRDLQYRVDDIMSVNTWGDWFTIGGPMALGSVQQALGMSDMSTFEPFLFRASWRGTPVTFVQRDNGMRLLPGGWPYVGPKQAD